MNNTQIPLVESPKQKRTSAKLLAKRRVQRWAREQAYKDLGLIKVKGALGGIYYE